jgi:hypothetical protein
MPNSRTLLTVVLALALVATLVGFGAFAGPRRGDVLTDRLGPEPSEPVVGYLDRAAAALAVAEADAGADAGELRYALVSFTTELSVADALTVLSGARVSELIYHVPMPRVQTPIVAVAVPDNTEAALRSAGLAAERVGAGRTERAEQVAAVSAGRLRAGCACVAGALVHANPATLASIAQRERVRAVEALAPDAVYGRIAIMPLLPEQDRIAAPGPDDGPVPVR